MNYSLVFLAIIFTSACNQTATEEKEAPLDTNSVVTDTIKDSIPPPAPVLPEAFLFKYSECMGNCIEEPGIRSIKDKGDSVFLKVAAIENCIAKFEHSLRYSHDTLWIDIQIKPELIKNRKGGYDTIEVMSECDCYFYFDIGIKNLIHGHKVIYIDGYEMGKGKPTKYLLEPDIEFPKGEPEERSETTDSIHRH